MTDLILDRNSCNFCRNGHGDIVCNCGHSHNQHVQGVGCAVRNEAGKHTCLCNGYSQTKLRKFDETDEQFNARAFKLGYGLKYVTWKE